MVDPLSTQLPTNGPFALVQSPLCGEDEQFSLTLTSPSETLPNWIWIDSVDQLIIFDNSSIQDIGEYIFELEAITTGSESAVTTSSFTIELTEPCLDSTINSVDSSYIDYYDVFLWNLNFNSSV